MARDELMAEIQELRSEVDTLNRRVGRLESKLDSEVPSEKQQESNTKSTRTHSQDHRTSDSEMTSSSQEQRGGDHSSAGDGDTTDDEGQNWEQDVGIKWLGRVGGAALVLGIVFFIRVTIEAGILGPFGRVTAGAIGGIALLTGGRYATVTQGYQRWGRITAGTGLAITFFSIYAAYGFESYRAAIGAPLWVVLVGLTVLIGSTGIVSVSDGNPLVAGEAFLLGYATAYLGLEAGSFVLTPAYALLLTLGVVISAIVRPWSRYVTISIPLAYGLVIAWLADFDPGWGAVAGVIGAVFTIYVAGSIVLGRGDHTTVRHNRLLRVLTILNAAFAATLLEWTVREWFPELSVEGAGVAVVALALGGIYAATSHQSVSRDDTAGTIAVVLLGVSVVLGAGPFAGTVGLLTITVGAIAVTRYGVGDATRTGGQIVAIGTVGKLLAVDARELNELDLVDPLANATGRPAAFFLVIVTCYGLAWWFKNEALDVPRRNEGVALATPYLLTATALSVIGLGIELSGFGLSIAWATLGAVLLGGGLRTDTRLFRFQGMIVFGLTAAKVFLFDTQGLDMVARTISFLVLGSFLLAAAYAYARWQGDRPLENIV